MYNSKKYFIFFKPIDIIPKTVKLLWIFQISDILTPLQILPLEPTVWLG
jgi:hypothetical protein